jgi:hypothetical protein
VADPTEPKQHPTRLANRFGSAFQPDSPDDIAFSGPGETVRREWGAEGGSFERSGRKPAPKPADSEFELQIGARKIRKKAGAGGKLSRSETVTVRLDPKLRYLAELAARKQRRTLSSFIEWAIEENLKTIFLDSEGRNEALSIASQASDLWDVDDPDRFAKLAIRYPQMLTHYEQVLWKLIRENGYLWKGHYNQKKKWTWEVRQDSLIFERLRETWKDFCSVAYESDSKEKLPTWCKHQDDEIPF